MWACVCVRVVIFGCVYVWVLECVGVCVGFVTSEFCDVWLCVRAGFVICGFVYVWVFNMWVCVCVSFVMCGSVYVWVLKYFYVCMCGIL